MYKWTEISVVGRVDLDFMKGTYYIWYGWKMFVIGSATLAPGW